MATVPEGCRKPDPERDWPLYVDHGPSLGADLHAVWPLTDAAAEVFWDSMVDAGQPSYRQLPAGHRLSRYTAYGPNWYTYANDPQLPDAVAAFLRESLPWPEQQVAFYTHRPRCVYRMSWGVLLRHWRRFMLIDESWVFGLGWPEFALFADAGGLAVGDMRPEAE
ncbi:MAG TPA: DUF2947 family protein [Gemmataceae bacterium]|nr:DUF2947 family protein [Gemmataceae bacterium]